MDDLLKLAKQFDFNMNQQEEAHLRPNPQSSAEAQDLFFDESDPPASPQALSEAERPPLGLEDTKMNSDDPLDDLGLIQEMDDDLDLLFEGSTQQLSGSLSQGFSARSQEMLKFAPQCGMNPVKRERADSSNACDVTRVGGAFEASTVRVCVATPVLSTISGVGVDDDFDNDWNNDDLLDDLMDMTQNSERFSAPQHSSTQKQTNKNTICHQNGNSEAKYGEVQRLDQRFENFQHSQNWKKTKENENVRQSEFHAKNSESQVFPSSKVPSMELQPLMKPMKIQQPLATTSSNSTRKVPSATTALFISSSDLPRSVPSATIETIPTFRISKVTKEKGNHPTMEDDVLCDLAAEDLDSIFASDDIWDECADDDLFCKACEKVEESMAEPEPPPKASVSNPTPQSSNVQSSQNTVRKRENVFVRPSPSNTQVYDRSITGNRVPLSTGVLHGAHINNTSGMYKFSHVKSKEAGSANGKAARQVNERATATTIQSYQRIQDNRQFKKPHNTFNAAPNVSKGKRISNMTP